MANTSAAHGVMRPHLIAPIEAVHALARTSVSRTIQLRAGGVLFGVATEITEAGTAGGAAGEGACVALFGPGGRGWCGGWGQGGRRKREPAWIGVAKILRAGVVIGVRPMHEGCISGCSRCRHGWVAPRVLDSLAVRVMTRHIGGRWEAVHGDWVVRLVGGDGNRAIESDSGLIGRYRQGSCQMHLRMLMQLPLGREDSEASWIPTHQVGYGVVGLQTSVRRMIKAMSDGVRSSVMEGVESLIWRRSLASKCDRDIRERYCRTGTGTTVVVWWSGTRCQQKKKNLPGISRGRMHIRCMRLRAELRIGPVILYLHAGSSSLPIGARPVCSALHVGGKGARR